MVALPRRFRERTQGPCCPTNRQTGLSRRAFPMGPRERLPLPVSIIGGVATLFRTDEDGIHAAGIIRMAV